MPSLFGELQPRFDDPDGIRCSTRGDPCNGGCSEMDVGVFLSVVETVGDDSLAVAVGEKVDGTSGNNADECWTESLEQCTRRLVTVDVAIFFKKKKSENQCLNEVRKGRLYAPKNVTRLYEIPQQTSRTVREGSYPTADDADRSVLFSKETRLETRLDDIKRARHNGTTHSAETNLST